MVQRTRFAPSPTGFLHRGHAISAFFVWGIAHLLKIPVHLRIEDHDQGRCRQEYMDAIQTDLEWLGLEWDSYSLQSSHFDRYEQQLRIWQQQGLAYPCSCTRKTIQAYWAQQGKTQKPDQEMPYPNLCRHLLPSPGLTDIGWRLKLPSQDVFWQDLCRGIQKQNPEKELGDLLLKDRQGNWTYQFAVVMDDWQESMDLIVRGEDLWSSSARQVLLATMLQRPQPPLFFHHPLYKKQEKKLSKRQHSFSLRAEKVLGITPQELWGSSLYAMDILPQNRPVNVDEFPSILQSWLRSHGNPPLSEMILS